MACKETVQKENYNGESDMTILFGILSCIEEYKILYSEVKQIKQSDFDKGYTKPSVQTYYKKKYYSKKKYYPPKDALSRSAPMTGQGRVIYKDRWR